MPVIVFANSGRIADFITEAYEIAESEDSEEKYSQLQEKIKNTFSDLADEVYKLILKCINERKHYVSNISFYCNGLFTQGRANRYWGHIVTEEVPPSEK